MGCEIRREYEGGDQREIRLRGPIEENPTDHGRSRRIGPLNRGIAQRNRGHRHAEMSFKIVCVFCPSRSKPYSITTGRNFSQDTAEILMMSIATKPGRIIAALALLTAFALPSEAQERSRGVYTPLPLGTVHATVAEHGMVVAQEKIAARVGADILRQGGNAVDAAVATGFAMAVTYPRAGNIGGGGFMVVHLADRNEDAAIDYREAAPAATTRDIFLGADGKPDTDKSRNSALGIGVPGTVTATG